MSFILSSQSIRSIVLSRVSAVLQSYDTVSFNQLFLTEQRYCERA